MFKLVLEKAEEPEIKCQHLLDHQKMQESYRKTSTSALLTMPKPLTVWLTTNCEKFFKRWEYQTTWSASWETCMQQYAYSMQEATVRTGHGTTDWFQIGKGVRQGCILSPCLFNFYAEYIMRTFDIYSKLLFNNIMKWMLLIRITWVCIATVLFPKRTILEEAVCFREDTEDWGN